MFCCYVEECRKIVRREIEKESKIMEKYPGVRVGDCGKAPEFEKLIQIGPAVGDAPFDNARAALLEDQQLGSTSEVKVLRLDPDEPASDINCKSVKWPFKANPQFVELDYNDTEPMRFTANIIIDGKTLSMPIKLVDELRRLRSRDKPIFIDIRDDFGTIRSEIGGVGIGIVPLKSPLEDIRQNRGASWKPDDKLSKTCVVYQATEEGHSKQLIAMRYDHSASLSSSGVVRATSGAILKTGSRYYYLTAAHAFLSELHSEDAQEAINDVECDIGEESEGDSDEVRDLMKTSRGSLTPDPTENSVSDATSSSAEAPADLDARVHEISMPDAKANTETAPSVDLSVVDTPPTGFSGPTSQHLEAVGYIDYSVAKDNPPGLDYLLIEITNPHFQRFNEISFNTETKTIVLYPQNTLQSCPDNKAVFAVTGSSGVLQGTISGTPTFSMLANGKGFQEMWTIRLEGKVEVGDSGSLVVDAENGDAIGHIVSGSPETGVVYVIPMYQVMQNIQTHQPLHLAMRANSKPKLLFKMTSIATQTEAANIDEKDEIFSISKGKGIAAASLPAARRTPTVLSVGSNGNGTSRNLSPSRHKPFSSLNAWLASNRASHRAPHPATRSPDSDNMSQSSTYVGSAIAEFTQHSNSSRVTVVIEDDPDLVSYRKEKPAITKMGIGDRSWLLLKRKLGLVRKGEGTHAAVIKAPLMAEAETEEVCCENYRSIYIKLNLSAQVNETSPWILPVLVLSTFKNADDNFIPKPAQCTIDTGNMQGNFVSLQLIEELGYKRSEIRDLTEAEKGPGMSVTGNPIKPVGAVYLTWYHKNSTRVFRNMRFLIIENAPYDLVIGARSIQKDGLLVAPNLETGVTNVGEVVVDKSKSKGKSPQYVLVSSSKARSGGKREEKAAKEMV